MVSDIASLVSTKWTVLVAMTTGTVISIMYIIISKNNL